MKTNQCAGCQSEWPVMKTVFGGIVHMVQGGYPHEVMSCTSDRYGFPRCRECGHFESEHKEDDEGWSTCYNGADGERIPCNCGNNIGR